jgi:chitin disaccharide deacetylase
MIKPFSDTASPPAPSAPIRLVVNADDFGVSTSINSGILRAHREGIVTATSLMAVGRAFENAVELLQDASSLDVGVHLTVVGEAPLLSPNSSLAGGNGHFFPSAGTFTLRWLTGRICKADVEAEWSAQIERVINRGISVSHLDSHQHVHTLPGLADLTKRLAARYHIPFVRAPAEALRLERPFNVHGISRLTGSTLLRVLWNVSRLTSIGRPQPKSLRFLGFQEGGRLNQERLRQMLGRLRPGWMYELMCHPGLTPEEPDLRRWNYGHEAELQALTSPSIQTEITAQNILLSTFNDLIY